MSKAKQIQVKESIGAIRKYIKKATSSRVQSRLQMLIVMKKSDRTLSAYELAERVGVNYNSIISWRKLYEKGGIEAILQHHQGGKRTELVDARTHRAIEKRLTNPQKGFSSYKELQQWVDAHYIPHVKYITLVKYVQRQFGAKLKSSRKSHIHKEEQAVEDFKKNSSKASETH
jgi:transposase